MASKISPARQPRRDLTATGERGGQKKREQRGSAAWSCCTQAFVAGATAWVGAARSLQCSGTSISLQPVHGHEVVLQTARCVSLSLSPAVHTHTHMPRHVPFIHMHAHEGSIMKCIQPVLPQREQIFLRRLLMEHMHQLPRTATQTTATGTRIRLFQSPPARWADSTSASCPQLVQLPAAPQLERHQGGKVKAARKQSESKRLQKLKVVLRKTGWFLHQAPELGRDEAN